MDLICDYWYDELCKLLIVKGKCEIVQVVLEDLLFILYIFGFIGKLKVIVYIYGGYQVGIYIIFKQCFDIKEEDCWWCIVDLGWIMDIFILFMVCCLMVLLFLCMRVV